MEIGEVGGSSHTTKELSHDLKSSMAFFAPISRGVKLPPFTMGNGLEYDTNPYFFIYFYFDQCGKFRIFLSLRFYVKNLEVLKMLFLPFKGFSIFLI